MGGFLRSGYGLAAAARRVGQAAAVLSLLVGSLAAYAGEPLGASTTEEAKADARRSVRLAKIEPAYQQAVRDVLASPSLFRRLPTSVVDCHPDLFTFLAQNPEVLVQIWRHLGVSQVQLTRLDEKTFDISDGAGTTGKLVVVEQTCEPNAQNRIVMYAEGSYEGKPFQQPLSASCVVVLTSGSVEETNGRRYVASRLDSFIKLDRRSLELVAKAVHPFVGQTADRNFSDTMSFVSNLSYTAETRPDAIEKLATDVEKLDQPRRAQLTKLAYECAEAGKRWQLSRGQTATAEVPAH
jgi:hypothetical protein